MTELRKITVDVDGNVLDAARADGAGVAETVREALAHLAHRRACERLLAMEGKLDLGLDLEELRKDKDEP
jgi:hypothetical protein